MNLGYMSQSGGVLVLTSSGAAGWTSVVSKTSISSPSAFAATAGEELTVISRGASVIFGLPPTMQEQRLNDHD